MNVVISGISSWGENELNGYPNPVTDWFTVVTVQKEVVFLALYDAAGQRIAGNNMNKGATYLVANL